MIEIMYLLLIYLRLDIRFQDLIMSGSVFLQLENQKQQVEAKLRERKMIDEKNCARCVAEIEAADSRLTNIKLRLSRRISRLNQLEETDLESKDEKELEQLTRDCQSWDFAQGRSGGSFKKNL